MSDRDTNTDFLLSVALLSGRFINHSILVPFVLHVRENTSPSQMVVDCEAEPYHKFS